jgi:hypothetical protein
MGKGLNKLAAALLIAGSSLVGMTPGVKANPVPWGDPALGHSWDQLWVETSDQAFNTVRATIIAPPDGSFESPGFVGFSVGSWVIQSATIREIVAQGPDTDRLEFITHFAGLPGDYTPLNPFVMDLYFLHDTTVVDAQRWIWDGNVWVDPPPDVPDGGATLLLLGFSALGMAAFFRRRQA